ncbi:hypothetical protein CkaCkLH20_12960 [Colletotrichum karsti]|uniref:Alternative oxidase n=1 Tax=Colletotrichum karsti TaxID=1095194 RepID=A0A9P6LET2_9PEZI|nr:uncharacterized protein CkaCkLH20_12960 [Colletotrichum karsti]KAF9869567.1 hypothetical protein CkaCkLH20_12960 [Colletotrichum karsti]
MLPNIGPNFSSPIVPAVILILIWVLALSTKENRAVHGGWDSKDDGDHSSGSSGGYRLLHGIWDSKSDGSHSSGSGNSLFASPSPESKYDSADLALMETCKNTKWTDGLWLSCHSECGPNKTSICGGLNNARNRLQTCLRLAIDIGAGVNFPHVTQRSEGDWFATDSGIICPDKWYDMERLKKHMAERCPSLRMNACASELEGNSTELNIPGRYYMDKPHFNETWRTLVNDTLVQSNVSLSDVNPENQLLLRYQDSHVAWSYRDSREMTTMRKALFNALHFNRTLLAIGEQLVSSEGLKGGNFIGIHLRAENDWPLKWGTPEVQMEQHAAEVRKTNKEADTPTKTVYVSCADRDVIQRFRDMMAPDNYTVTDKWMLFADRPEMLEIIGSLPFDQKAIIEYAVLLRGRYFQGNLISTMSSLVAYARTRDQPEEFFSTHIYPNTIRWGIDRYYSEPFTMRGDKHTKEFIISGQDIMDAFP